MIRTQIQLSERQAEALKELAARQNVSVAEIIRQAVDERLRAASGIDLRQRKQRALAVAGRFHSGHSDLSVEHDRHLAEAYGR
jgi:hypothetical protein